MPKVFYKQKNNKQSFFVLTATYYWLKHGLNGRLAGLFLVYAERKKGVYILNQ